jgi:opacity protein-like surface antigen
MRRCLAVAVLAVVLAGLASSPASADPNPDFLTTFTLDCGTAGSFSVGVQTKAPAPKPIFVLEDGSVFRVSSLAIAEVNNGAPLFYVPGLFDSGLPQLTCTFIGAETGRHFTVTGFFTPAA